MFKHVFIILQQESISFILRIKLYTIFLVPIKVNVTKYK
jgi:hypothetical protein